MPRRYDLPGQLINHAQGLHAASAAVELLCAHGAWLGKPAFVSRCAITGTHASGGPYACIDWSNAIAALDAGHIAGSGSENNILRIAASLGDPGIPVQLACVLGNLDPPTSAWSPQPSSAPTAVSPARPVNRSEVRHCPSSDKNTNVTQMNTDQSTGPAIIPGKCSR